MYPMPWQLVVATCAMGFVLLLHTVVTVADLLRTECSWTGSLAQCSRQSDAQGPRDTSDREASLIAERLADIRASYLKDWSYIWMHVCGLFAVLHFVWLFLGWHSHMDGVREIVIGISYVIVMAFRVHPALVNQNTLWMLHSAFMGLLLCDTTYIAITDSRLFLISYSGTQLIRVMLSLCYPAALPNFMWNSAWTLVSLATYIVDDNAFLGVPASNVIGNEVIFYGVMWFVVRRFQQLQVSLVQSQREAKGHLQAKSTVGKILSNMCDAVVELNRELEIPQPCPKLAGLLIRQESTLAMRGESFPGLLLNDADRDRFTEFVSRRAVPVEQEGNLVGDERTSSVYVNLRDTSGHTVSVQVFHSCHHSPPDDICHIVGVLEVQETQEAADLGAAGQQAAANIMPEPRESVDDETESVHSVASSDASRTERNGPPLLAPLIRDNAIIDPVGALIDPLNMHILACTTGFKAFTGPLFYKGNVGDIVIKMAEFEAWLQHEDNACIGNQETKKLELKLTPPMVGKRPQFKFNADAYIIDARLKVRASQMGLQTAQDADHEGEGEEEEEEEYNVLCLLALRNVEPHWSRATRRRARGSPVVADAIEPKRDGISL